MARSKGAACDARDDPDRREPGSEPGLALGTPGDDGHQDRDERESRPSAGDHEQASPIPGLCIVARAALARIILQRDSAYASGRPAAPSEE